MILEVFSNLNDSMISPPERGVNKPQAGLKQLRDVSSSNKTSYCSSGAATSQLTHHGKPLLLGSAGTRYASVMWPQGLFHNAYSQTEFTSNFGQSFLSFIPQK